MDNKIKLPKKDKKNSKQLFKIYILPIIVGLGFMAIIFLLVFPNVISIFSILDEISQKNDDYSQKLTMLNDLKTLNSSSSTIISQLNSVNKITTADQTEVVKFRNKITEVILSNNLNIFSQQLTETDPTIITNGETQSINLKEVPFTFKIEGSYNDIVKFFNDLSVINDFVIIKEMTFSRTDTLAKDNSTVWLLNLVLVKYQFDSSESLKDIYKSISPSSQMSPKVLEYIQKRTLN